MALAATNSGGYVVVSSATRSDHINLVPGRRYMLSFSSAGAFALDLQVLAGDGSSWDDVYDGTTQVTIDSSTGVQNTIVYAGIYRMDVNTYNNPITMWAREV